MAGGIVEVDWTALFVGTIGTRQVGGDGLEKLTCGL